MKHFIMIFIIGLLASGCSSSPKKQRLGIENGWLCTTSENAKKTQFKEVSVPGQKKNEVCIEMKGDRDPYWDFYIRDYERSQLPDMPETP